MPKDESLCKGLRAKPVNNVQLQEKEDISSEDSDDYSPVFVYTIESTNPAEDEQFYETIHVENTKVNFQLDSGAKQMLCPFRPIPISSVCPTAH